MTTKTNKVPIKTTSARSMVNPKTMKTMTSGTKKASPNGTIVNWTVPKKEANKDAGGGSKIGSPNAAVAITAPAKSARSDGSAKSPIATTPVAAGATNAQNPSTAIPKSETPSAESTFGYELVKPKAQTSQYFSDERSAPTLATSGRWWKKKERKFEIGCYVIIFGVIVLALVGAIALLASGGVIRSDSKEKTATLRFIDSRLKTKTEACRASAKGSGYERFYACINEVEAAYGDCHPWRVCAFNLWKFDGSGGVFNVTKQSAQDFTWPSTDAAVLDYADCGYLKWCRKGKCEKADVSPLHWWTAKQLVFAHFDGSYVVPKPSPCLVVDDSDEEQWSEIQHHYVDKCNTSACDISNGVKFGIKFEFHQCNLSVNSLTTGIRRKPCEALERVLQFDVCPCDGYDYSAESEVRNCSNGAEVKYDDYDDDSYGCRYKCSPDAEVRFVPNGVRCGEKTKVDGNTSTSVCFMGGCRPYKAKRVSQPDPWEQTD